jgi:Ca-activated chloride channel family protein
MVHKGSSSLMLQFANPLLLLLLLAVPPGIWVWQRKRRRALRFPVVGILGQMPPGKERLVRWLGLSLAAFGLAALVAGLAGPRWPDARSRIPVEGVSIAIVVDVSGSMAEPDFDWGSSRMSRLEAAKQAFGLLVRGGVGPNGEQFQGRPNDQICLVTFSTRPQDCWPLTLSHEPLLQILGRQAPRSLPTDSETNIGDAIALALDRLTHATTRHRVLVLLSDGEHNVPPPALKPRQAAQLAAALEVPIYAIQTGGKEKNEGQAEVANPRAEVDGARTLRAVASLTRGKYFQADDAASLLGACEEIDRLERQEILSFQYRRYFEGYPLFGLASLGCFGFLAFLSRTYWSRIP